MKFPIFTQVMILKCLQYWVLMKFPIFKWWVLGMLDAVGSEWKVSCSSLMRGHLACFFRLERGYQNSCFSLSLLALSSRSAPFIGNIYRVSIVLEEEFRGASRICHSCKTSVRCYNSLFQTSYKITLMQTLLNYVQDGNTNKTIYKVCPTSWKTQNYRVYLKCGHIGPCRDRTVSARGVQRIDQGG